MRLLGKWVRAPLLLVLAVPGAEAQPQQVVPCINDCLQEALASNPVKGCPNGTYWVPYPRNSPTDACQPCSPGFYCPGVPYGEFPAFKINLNRRIACPRGSFRATPGAKALAECVDCPPGKWQDWNGRTACVDCLAGSYLNASGSASKYDCVDCPCGHYCAAGSAEPSTCPMGTFTRNDRMMVNASCLQCPPGTACPEASCDPLTCASCPAGKFSSESGTSAIVAPGGNFGVGGCLLQDDGCRVCPPSFFCPTGSAVPISCPPGTYSAGGATAEQECVDCPLGHSCRLPVNASTAQSLVHRDGNGEDVVGSAVPVACAVDATTIHHSYVGAGCVEGCPYNLTRQSFCHVAGDGRPPDRSRAAERVAQLLAQRQVGSFATSAARAGALGELAALLSSMSSADARDVMSLPDRNGRTAAILAAMRGDVPALQALWAAGLNATDAAAVSRDVGGMTALMHALRLGRAPAVAWLVGTAAAALALGDAERLEQVGINISGVPVAALRPAPEYLGVGGFTWSHSSGGHFVDSPLMAVAQTWAP